MIHRHAALAVLLCAALGCNGPEAKKSGGLKELKTTDTVVGTGPGAAKGDRVWMSYTGRLLKSGVEFDSNVGGNKSPYPLVLGAGSVIKGWEQGIPGMKAGGKRILEIPSELAYGEYGSPPNIGPNEDLKFEVELHYVMKPGEDGMYDKIDVKVGTGPEAKEGDVVEVHYVGKYLNGVVFDDSRKRPDPARFPIGPRKPGMEIREAILGMQEGVKGMRVGGVRKLRIPPALAFGDAGGVFVEPYQVLDFEVELISVNGRKG